jgi:hypothetical protein
MVMYLEDEIKRIWDELLEARESRARIEKALEQKMKTPPKWLRTPEAMSMLDCSVSQLQRYRSQDRVIWKKVGNTVYHDRGSLNDLIENEK